jgi:hypothetical protein
MSILDLFRGGGSESEKENNQGRESGDTTE